MKHRAKRKLKVQLQNRRFPVRRRLSRIINLIKINLCANGRRSQKRLYSRCFYDIISAKQIRIYKEDCYGNKAFKNKNSNNRDYPKFCVKSIQDLQDDI